MHLTVSEGKVAGSLSVGSRLHARKAAFYEDYFR